MCRSWYPLVLVVLVQLSAASDPLNQLELTARWGNPFNAYFPLPLTLREATAADGRERWHVAHQDTDLRTSFVSHKNDPRFFIMYDKKGTIAGVTFGFDKSDVNRVMGLNEDHMYIFPDTMFRSPQDNKPIWTKDLWHYTVLFAHPDQIRTTGIVDDVINQLFYYADSKWNSVPLREEDVNFPLRHQGCYNGMGQHYFHNTDDKTSCSEWQGAFFTYHRGVLAGFGVAVFGSFLDTYYTQTYYEYPTFDVVRRMLPNRPRCMDKWLPFTGITSVHVFLVKQAAKITCPAIDIDILTL
ncbi:uncharacterized protein LOC128982813 [Macrosteles quadrilineatus]|uniref:uncharacterized protein LOC128982813 n=1 Tax=Macrosteles quadrilineatus TaxID=74068 RepID=UPI0023E2E611|nr:uncharacterized protein LOC128982813 [Macrosteles quadrilineatus]